MTEEQTEAKPGGILPEHGEDDGKRQEKKHVRRRRPQQREKVQ